MDSKEAEEYTQAAAQTLGGGWRFTLLGKELGVPQALGLSLEEWQQRLGGYTRLAVTERRDAVAELTEQGMSTREAAEVLGVSHQTVANDLDAVKNLTEQPKNQASDQTDTVKNLTEDPIYPEPEPETVAVPTIPERLESLAPGWHQLGEHRLYCGDSTDQDFIDACAGAAFAFADPPYNAGKAEWDQDFLWKHDYLADNAAIVAVTPGIVSLPGFFKISDMPYQWSIAAEITNGMTRGALGFGNWICVPVFAHGSIYRNSKDVLRIPASTGEDKSGNHPSRKPLRLLTALIELFTSKGDLVIDPFLGSGTTLLAAERTGRRCIGAEIDPTYCAEIAARWKAA